MIATVTVLAILWMLKGVQHVRVELFSPNETTESKIELSAVTIQNSVGDRHINVIVLIYSGQQGAGINSFTSLQCWARHTHLPISIVEPAIETTRIATVLKDEDKDTVTLGEIFDLKQLSKTQEGYTPVISRNDFINKPPSNVIVVRFGNESLIWSSENGEECYKEKTGSLLKQLGELGHCIVKVVRVASTTLTREKLLEILGQWVNTPVTLVFSRWGTGMTTFPECTKIGKGILKDHLHPSQHLLQDASRYTDLYIGNKSYTALMIRLERIAQLDQRHRSEHSISECLETAERTVQQLHPVGNMNSKLMMTSDVGEYGSTSWHWAVKDKEKLALGTNATKSMMERLLQNKMNFSEWERSFITAAGGVTNKGYIAALQRTIASQAECLVLLGGGNFQNLALNEYLHLHQEKHKRCIYLICIINEKAMNNMIN